MKRAFTLLFACVLALAVPFCAACDDSGLKKIRLSEVAHSIFYAPLYIAINNGYFEEEGFEIELSNAGGADLVMVALTSRSADIGLMGAEATV